MNNTLSSDELGYLLEKIISQDGLHARFLNTLSLLENTGARKISASESAHNTTLMVLKHAAEEHRHAYYLKKQIKKLNSDLCPTYEPSYLLIPVASKQYLEKLDILTCRYIKNTLNMQGSAMHFVAYLLVTYSIELRADTLYPLYQQALNRAASKVSVKSIILEEQGHLEEMISQLEVFSTEWEKHADVITAIEKQLFEEWIRLLTAEIEVPEILSAC